MKKIICTVTTDLVFDQRMRRICTSLSNAGYDVLLIGRKKKKSPELTAEKHKQHRIECWFEKGPLFYLEFNIRLFLYLITHKTDAVSSIDLDTILPGRLASIIKGFKQTYDAHEYFTEMEELADRKLVKTAWKIIEKITVPFINHGYTVSEGYADLFKSQYGVEYKIVRNATVLIDEIPDTPKENIILYQGAVNYGRGLISLIEAMHKVKGTLIICGDGDLFEIVKKKIDDEHLEKKVKLLGYIQPLELKRYTKSAKIGLTLFEAKGLSNKYSMANRFFDYMHAGMPQLAMNYPEYQAFNKKYEVAKLLDDLDAFTIASSLNHLLKDENHYQYIRNKALEARKEFNWQNEEARLISVYQELFA